MALRKIRILHLIKSLGRGGAEMLLPETLKLHDQGTFEFYYIYFLPWKDQMVESIATAGGIVKCLPASNNIKILMKSRQVISFCRANEIDLIHCHLPWAGFLGRWIHRNTKIPVVYTEHNKQERYHGITSLINRYTFNWQSRAIAVSNDVATSIRKNIQPVIPVQAILNGVNVETFRRDKPAGKDIRSELGIPSGAIVIGTVAVFRFQKRLEQWLEVMKRLCDHHANVYGIIVGDGPLRDKIVDKRKELGLEEKVKLPGLKTDVKPWLSAIDIYMMSSLFEGMPIAMLEAMSMECAVVSTDAGGIKELIRDKKDGLLVNVENWSDMTQLVERLLDKDVRNNYAQTARQRVVESFSLNKMVEQLEGIYYKETDRNRQ